MQRGKSLGSWFALHGEMAVFGNDLPESKTRELWAFDHECLRWFIIDAAGKQKGAAGTGHNFPRWKIECKQADSLRARTRWLAIF